MNYVMKAQAPTGVAVTRLARIRVAQVLVAAGLGSDTPLERMSSVTNEVWGTKDFLVRVNRRADGRLKREASLAACLPDEIRYPEVINVAEGIELDWMITKRKPGQPLSRAWPTMPESLRIEAMEQLAGMLRALHATPFPENIASLDNKPQLLDAGSATPTHRLHAALAKMAKLQFIDDELVHAIAREVSKCTMSLDLSPATNFVHGDLTFENILWDGKEIVSILDFEWSRAEPADLDLDILLRLSAYPFLHVAPDYEAQTLARDYRIVPEVLEQHYPELWDREGIVDRLTLYSIAYDVGALLRFPPKDHPSRLSEHHPVNRLRRCIAGTSHVHEFLQAGFSL